MELQFCKYHGAGNDFILFDDRDSRFPFPGQSASDSGQLVASLCNRHTGIGADGLILLRSSGTDPSFDFEMIYFNADGNLGSLCGNGSRCAVRFAMDLGLVTDQARFTASDGEHSATLTATGDIRLQMNPVSSLQTNDHNWILDTGSPHFVRFVTDLSILDVAAQGASIRHSPEFEAAGINVNFVEESAEGLQIRTFERGVEAETLACGTGVVASAIAWAHEKGLKGSQSVELHARGGDLKVEFDVTAGGAESVFLTGPAQKVFSGTFVTEVFSLHAIRH